MSDHTKESVLQLAHTIKTRREFWHQHYSAMYHARKHGYLDEAHAIIDANKLAIRTAKAKDGIVKHQASTLEVMAFVAKYASREEMRKADRDMYYKAIHRGLLKHLPRVSVVKWTPLKILAEALKYKNRGEFCRGSQCAYKRAQETGILDTVCLHMPKPWGGKRKAYRKDEAQTKKVD